MGEDYAGGSTITTSSSNQVISPNRLGRRISISITNYGTNTAWLMLSSNQPAAVGYGIPLYVGETITDSSSDVYQCWQGAVACIQAAAGTTTLSVWERVQL